jgi:putative aminopeptidase FrvX
MIRSSPRLIIAVILVAFIGGEAWAATAAPADLKNLVRQLYPIPSATGNEELLASRIASLLPKAAAVERDNLGGLFAKFGAGEAALAVVAPVDEFGYVVSNILPDGYLQLDRLGTPPVGIYDSFLMGHSVVISTRAGLRSGIVVQPSMHVLSAEMRDKIAKSLTLDMIYIDVGAHTEAEARAKGIEILDPVTFSQDLAVLANDRWAGPALGLKVNAGVLAALAEAAAQGPPSQTTALAWMTQTRMSARGSRSALGAVRARNRLSPKAAIVLGTVPADRGENSPAFGKGIVVIQAKEGPMKLRDAVDAAAKEKGIALQSQTGGEGSVLTPFLREGAEALVLALPVKFSGTPSEVVDMKDAQALLDLVSDIVRSGRLK